MKLKAYLACICLLLIAIKISAQNVNATVIMDSNSSNSLEIVYKKGVQLSLTDFLGPVDNSMNAVAMAYTGFTLKYQAYSKKNEITLEIRLYPSFDKTKSWCMEKAKNDWTLAHEQRHFDITIINACALFRALKQAKFTKDFAKEIAEIQTKFKKINEQEQDLYDAESNHGINKEKQAEWNQRLLQRLLDCADCYK